MDRRKWFSSLDDLKGDPGIVLIFYMKKMRQAGLGSYLSQ